MLKKTFYPCNVLCPSDFRIYPIEFVHIKINRKNLLLTNGCDFYRTIGLCPDCILYCQNVLESCFDSDELIPNPIKPPSL